MVNLFFCLTFSLFSLFVLIKTCSYGLFEIHEENNLSGGISVIIFTFLCVCFSNFMVWLWLMK